MEFSVNTTGSSSGRRKSGTSRANSVRSLTVTVIHTSGVRESGEIPEGRYSKRQMREQKEALVEELKHRIRLRLGK